MSWAEQAEPIIAAVIDRVGREDIKVLRKALAAAYPWGERENAPYKGWCAEVTRQLGHQLSKPKPVQQKTYDEAIK